MIGSNVDREGLHLSPDLARSIGVPSVRFAIHPDIDQTNYINRCLELGIGVVLVTDRPAFGDADLNGLPINKARRVVRDYGRFHKERYGRFLNDKGTGVYLQAGNEPDGEGESSFQLTQPRLNMLGQGLREVFPDAYMLSAGFCSGNPDWLLRRRGVVLGHYDGIALQLYGQATPPEFGGEDPYGFGGDIRQMVDRYRDTASQLGFGGPIRITEWGANDLGLGEWYAGRYGNSMFRWANDAIANGVIEGFDDFCASDAMVEGFGGFRIDGGLKPIGYELMLANGVGWNPQEEAVVESRIRAAAVRPGVTGLTTPRLFPVLQRRNPRPSLRP